MEMKNSLCIWEGPTVARSGLSQSLRKNIKGGTKGNFSKNSKRFYCYIYENTNFLTEYLV